MAVTSQRRQSLIPGRGAFCLAPGLLHHWCDDKNISRISSSAKFCNYFFNCAFFFFSILSIKKSLIASSPVVPTEKKEKQNRINDASVYNGICNSAARLCLCYFQERDTVSCIGEWRHFFPCSPSLHLHVFPIPGMTAMKLRWSEENWTIY